MNFIPAYDQGKERPVLIIRFDYKTRFDGSKPQSYGQQFTKVHIAIVSDETGHVFEILVEDLIVLWTMVRILKPGTVPTFKAIDRTYKRMINEIAI